MLIDVFTYERWKISQSSKPGPSVEADGAHRQGLLSLPRHALSSLLGWKFSQAGIQIGRRLKAGNTMFNLEANQSWDP
jgi:hypothetical protein